MFGTRVEPNFVEFGPKLTSVERKVLVATVRMWRLLVHWPLLPHPPSKKTQLHFLGFSFSTNIRILYRSFVICDDDDFLQFCIHTSVSEPCETVTCFNSNLVSDVGLARLTTIRTLKYIVQLYDNHNTMHIKHKYIIPRGNFITHSECVCV